MWATVLDAVKNLFGMGDEAAETATDIGKAADNVPCPVNSFSAETLVMTPGGLKPIAELVEGELVLAYNEATGEIGAYPIVDTISHVDPKIVLLTIDGETLETTAEHPFYELQSAPWLAVGQTEARWTDALQLKAGDLVWKADGTHGVVESVEVVPVQQQMYNLTVDVAHTFFVGDGQWLLVR
jgi:intein/homing endonuclease